MKNSRKYLLSEKTYSFLIAAVLVTIPLPFAFSTVALIILLAVSVLSLFYHKIEFKIALFIPIVVYLLMASSLIWSLYPDRSLRGLERQLPLLLVPLAFIFMPSISRKALFQAFYVFAMALAGFFYSLSGLFRGHIYFS